MFTRRSDLPLDKDALSRFLPWLIAFMVFLAVLAVAGMLVLDATAARWDRGIRGTLTVQIVPAETAAKDDERLQKVLLILGELPEVHRFETLGDAKLMTLLEPWLGSTAAAGDLPLPRLIDVEGVQVQQATCHLIPTHCPGLGPCRPAHALSQRRVC